MESVLNTNTPLLVINRGTPGSGSLTLDLSIIYNAESRLREISFLTNSTTAVELMHFFNNAANECGKYLGALTYEELTAQNELEKIKSVIVLDKIPEELAARGIIKTNEDIRQAIIVQDVAYQKQLDVLNHVKAVSMFITEKYRSFVRSYNACKMITDHRQSLPSNLNTSTFVGSTTSDPNDPLTLKTFSGGNNE